MFFINHERTTFKVFVVFHVSRVSNYRALLFYPSAVMKAHSWETTIYSEGRGLPKSLAFVALGVSDVKCQLWIITSLCAWQAFGYSIQQKSLNVRTLSPHEKYESMWLVSVAITAFDFCLRHSTLGINPSWEWKTDTRDKYVDPSIYMWIYRHKHIHIHKQLTRRLT